jgi:hypothetical protein
LIGLDVQARAITADEMRAAAAAAAAAVVGTAAMAVCSVAGKGVGEWTGRLGESIEWCKLSLSGHWLQIGTTVEGSVGKTVCVQTVCVQTNSFFSMAGASLGALPPAGWACNVEGEIKNGKPQCQDNEEDAVFKQRMS